VIVVDNGSKGNDADVLEEKYGDYIKLIRNKENLGFAGGNNVGIKEVLREEKSKYILLLNNDTVVTREFLTELVKVAENNEKIGSVQSLLLKPGGELIDSLGQELFLWGARDKGLYSKTQNHDLKENREIFGSCAAAALYRTKVLREIGLFDEDFFSIFEDLDFSWKIRLAGFRSFLAVRSIVYHKRGVSGGLIPNKELVDLMKYHINKNWLLIVTRYYPTSLISFVATRHPYQFFRKLLASIFFSLKIKRIKGPFELYKLLKKSLIVRSRYSSNLLLPSIQNKWIKRKM